MRPAASENHVAPDRSAGLLLHPTSLPGLHGCGDIGAMAHQFIDYLAAAGQRWWQMLPIGPVGGTGVPYSSDSAFAASPLLIEFADLVRAGLLRADEVRPMGQRYARRVDYPRVIKHRHTLLRRAFARFDPRGDDFAAFCHEEHHWLDDYALFAAIKAAMGHRHWTLWPHKLALRDAAAMREARRELHDALTFICFTQYQFVQQWRTLRAHAHRNGIQLIGDIPIYVDHDSTDVWAHRALFRLDAKGRCRFDSGMPPDYFCADGQRWGHPLYAWSKHRATKFAWWTGRVTHALRYFDAVRIDHFPGFCRAWAIPAEAVRASDGFWSPVPGKALLSHLHQTIGDLPFIAEDLGDIPPACAKLRDQFHIAGMRILQFAFDDAHHLPEHLPEHCVAYTGTHDNDTLRGFIARQSRPRKRKIMRYAGGTYAELHWNLIAALYRSAARRVIVPMQDVLGLGSRARMNIPGEPFGQWGWRMGEADLRSVDAHRLAAMAGAAGRR